jgi:hypothetical protein
VVGATGNVVVGDYVAWPTFGVAALGGLLAIGLR